MNSPSHHYKSIVQIITAMLIMLFFYTATSKLSDIGEFRRQLSNQSVPDWSVAILLWLIPLSEILVCLLLIAAASRTAGLYGSALLMLIFTGYMGLVLLNVFDRVPCSCGGVLRSMDFHTHFIFNAVFLVLSISAIILQRKLETAQSQ